MRERNQLDSSIKSIRSIEHEFHENIELLELGENEGDIVIVAEENNCLQFTESVDREKIKAFSQVRRS